MKKKAWRTISRINHWGRSHKKLLLVFALVYVILLATALSIPTIRSALPYEIRLGKTAACYVKNENAAKRVVEDVKSHYSSEGARIVRFSSDPVISIASANPFRTYSKTIPEEEAVQLVVDRFDKSDSSKVSVSYVVNKTIKFTPKPTFKKDGTMLAGDERIEKKGKDGSKIVTSLVTSENGKEISREKYRTATADEGTPAVIYRGTLGLPTGEKWETYDGDPVYNNADDLVATAYNYIGAPYKHGGVSLQTGVSCVGFVRAIYLKYGIKIGNSHRSMETAGIGVSYSNVQKGDIICYKGHVGLYVGGGKMLDATSSRGVGVNTVHPSSIIAVRRIVQ